MDISCTDLGPSLRHIVFAGRLDIMGTDKISHQFAADATGGKRNVVVDFTGITFWASIGIRARISNARALHNMGGVMALVVRDNASVARTLDATGINVLPRTYHNVNEVELALTDLAA